jgi:hypothetical protein
MTVPAHCFDGSQKRGAYRRYPQTIADQTGNLSFGDGFTPPDKSAPPRHPERPSSSSA